MDQKLLVSYIKPVIESLQDDGLKITRADVWPGDINGYFTLAISAEWDKNDTKPRVLLVYDKIRAMMPHEISKYIVNKFTFDTPESIDEYLDYYVTDRNYFKVQSLYLPKLEAGTSDCSSSKEHFKMNQKLLVTYIKPVIQSLQDDGLKITRADVWPGDINGYFTLAISAEWDKNDTRPRVLIVLNKIRAMMPHEISKYIVNKFTFDTPESIDEYIDYYVTGRDYFKVQSLYPPKTEAVAAYA